MARGSADLRYSPQAMGREGAEKAARLLLGQTALFSWA